MFNIDGFKEAIKAANESDGVGKGKYKLGAAIYNRSKFICSGFNKNKTHPMIDSRFKYIHAENDCIVKAMKKVGDGGLCGCTLYIVRIGRTGKLRMSKPCPSCQKMLLKNGIKKVYYTNKNGEISEMML